VAEDTSPNSKICGIAFGVSLFHPRYWLTWIALGIAFMIAQLPDSARHALGRKVGNAIYTHKKKKRYNVVKANLEIAFPELSKPALESLIKEHLEWYGCALVDYSLLFFASQKRLSNKVVISGKEHIDQALADNKSIIILLAHSVMLEFGPAALGFHYESFGSYKTSKNAVMDWMIAKARCRHVAFVVSREEGLRKLVKSLIPGRLMIFLPDEDLGEENAVFVPFFKKQKATLTTTARLAKLGKATALPAFSWYNPTVKKYVLEIAPALKDYPTKDASADARQLNQALESLIKQHPAQYMWLLKWYRTQAEGEKNIYS
jgi:lipid A biosynthesis lauroyl/palmitoleoyl acyltransferase